MITEYFAKYCSYYLSRYSVSKKKFEHILKKKITKDFLQKKIGKEKYEFYLREVDNVIEHYKKAGLFNETRLIDLKVENMVDRGYSTKKIYYVLTKDFFPKELIESKISELKNLEEQLIQNYLKKMGILRKLESHLEFKKENFDKILKKLIQQGFSIQTSLNFLKKYGFNKEF